MRFLDTNESSNPKVPDVDKIVPLLPAKLPAWGGTFQWEKEQKAAKLPQKPTEELIKKMAKAKNLDPATGLPIPPSPRAALGTLARTGERCPETGIWRMDELDFIEKRHFRKGDTMPVYTFIRPRLFGLLE